HGETRDLTGRGNGPIDAFVRALNQADIAHFDVLSYAEHSLSQGSEALAACYVQIQRPEGKGIFGVAIDPDIEMASIKAVVSAVNRAIIKAAQPVAAQSVI